MSEHIFVNTKFKPHFDLGDGISFTDAEWQILKNKITTYMDNNASKSTLKLDDAQALDPAFLNPRVFAQAYSDLNLFIIRK